VANIKTISALLVKLQYFLGEIADEKQQDENSSGEQND